jgi:hypothetical protein
MPREELVRIPINEIYYMLNDLNRQRTQNAAGGRLQQPHLIVPSSVTYQKTDQPYKDLRRVPLNVEERLLARAARLRAEQETSKLDGQGARKAP